ncbi:MAG: DNA-binding protein [Promethearchaeota archaeon]
MQISDIRPGMTKINIKARVLSKDFPRSVRSKKGRTLRVCEAILGDKSGRITLTLWQKTIFIVNVDQVIEIKNGYASEYQGITKLTLGRNGTLEIVDDPSFPAIHDLLKDLRENIQP